MKNNAIFVMSPFLYYGPKMYNILGKKISATIKDDTIRNGISTYEFDIMGLAETNTDWRLVNEEDKLVHRTKGWWESLHLSFSFNVTKNPIKPNQTVEINIVITYTLCSFANNKVGIIIALKMMIPPIVGVPDFST